MHPWPVRTGARARLTSLFTRVVVVLAVLFASGDADARRKKASKPSGPKKIVVVPFEAEGALAYEVPKELELELELHEGVIVVASARTWAELKKQGAKKFDRKTLQKVMQRRGVDVLMRGVKGYDDDGAEALHVLLYANDGRVRFQGTLTESLDAPDALPGLIASVVEEPLHRFDGLAAIEPVFPAKPKKGAKPRAAPVVVDDEPPPPPPAKDAVDDSHLFVDFDDGKDKRDAKRAPPKRADLGDKPIERTDRRARVVGGDGDDDDDDDDEPAPRAATRAQKPAETTDDDEAPEDKPRRRRFDDPDDNEPEEKRPAARTRFIDEDDERASTDRDKKRDRASMADVVDDEKPAGDEPDLSHVVSVAVGAGGASWFYDFAANKPIQSNQFLAPIFPAGTLRIDLWPIEWVGVDVDAHLQAVRFNVDDPSAPIQPQTFFAYRYGASAAAKGRYILHLGNVGVGAGGRVGYRLLGAFADKQTHADDGDFFTVVPGYMFHTIFVGAELYAAVVFFERRLEFEWRLDGLPLTRYEEYPDNPGAESLAFGWATTANVRMEIFYGAFAELYFFHSGAIVTFDGVGNRRGALLDATSGQRELIQGGRVTTIDGTAGLALGWMW